MNHVPGTEGVRVSSALIEPATTSQVVMSTPDFASRLRWWRRHRRISQLDLAGRAEISQRHLSFLELGRASPSREMVLRLAAALDIPLRQQNALLLAAGFAPVWHETDFAAPELAPVRSGLDYILAQQEPFPAVVVDRRWNLLGQCRRGAPGRVPGRPACSRRAGQSGRCPGRTGRPSSLPRELGGRGPLLHAQRRGRCCRRWHRGNRRAAPQAAHLSRLELSCSG